MAKAADDTGNNAKADAAASKAPARAAEAGKPPLAVEAPLPDAPKTDTSKIALAVAEVKAAPQMTADEPRPVPVAKKAALKKATAAKAPASPPAAPALPVPAQTVEAPKRALPTISQLKDKIMENTTTQTNQFAETVKDTAAQAQTRAKAAYDRLQNYAGEMTEFTKGNVEALVESGKIVGAGVQDIARGEFEAAKSAFETLTADLKAMAAVKSPTELFQLQGEIARRNFDAAVARASKNAEVSVKLANDAFAPISSRMSVAAERLSNAA